MGSVRDGFSIIEALAATALLAIAMVPVYDMLTSLHAASIRLQYATQVPFVEASAIALITGPGMADAGTPEGQGELSIDGWHVEWSRQALTSPEPAAGSMGVEMIDIWLEQIELVFTLDGYRQTSVHTRLAWSPRYENFDAYIATLD